MSAPPRIPIAVFLTSFDSGGTDRQMTELIRRLDRGAFDVHVACFHRHGVWLPRAEELVADVAEFPVRGFRWPATLAQFGSFARWCRRRRIAVVQATDIYTNAFALPAASMAGVPVRVGSRREVHPTRGRRVETLQRFGYASAHRIVANSDVCAERLRREGVAPDRISLIRNGLDLGAFGLRPSPPRRHRIVCVGGLRPEKAHEVLVAAIGRLRPAWPDVKLRLIGDGPCEAALRELAAGLGLLDCVEFLGRRDDIPALLREADVFVLPSRTEASPSTVLEAMGAGLPIVASRVGGVPEAVTDGVTGLLVPPDNVDALVGAVSHLFATPSLGERLGLAARRHVQDHYSLARMVSAFENLYLAELARRGYRTSVRDLERHLQTAVS